MKNILLVILLIYSTQLFAKGNCPCPDNLDRAGRRCGKRSAFCKPGGESPSCGTKNEKERLELFRRAC